MSSCHNIIFLPLGKMGETLFRNFKGKKPTALLQKLSLVQVHLLTLLRVHPALYSTPYSLFLSEKMSLTEGYIKINAMRSKRLVFLLSAIGPGEELLYQDDFYVF